MYLTAEKLPKTWKTRDGREIPIRKMSDDHLLNAIGMLERNYDRGKYIELELAQVHLTFAGAASLHGDMAQMAAESELLNYQPTLEEILPVYVSLQREAKRRAQKAKS